ncbi:LacI family DNA-binding transcriptional regulator [Streptomyces longispororuber]|uniref:LacI family DNA-binding transcriptional regulator n=1 Tax=Streptomyces longispororuber TaxID=68230 RepID=UPI00210CB7FB|nr:LacI family DNA-binding transcriptional regulator [Streptomyces longispororuber]MCQ4209419.1 LacI family transcriptional regulator [Streptomyces longispororuber]
MANGYDVAKAAGVSQSTVSRVFRGDPLVAPRTRDAVLDAARRLGYAPNAAARALTTSRAHAVAVVTPDVVNPLYPQEITTLHEEFRSAGYRTVLLTRGAETGGAGPSDLEALRGGTVDGVVFAAATVESPAVDDFLESGMPLVLLHRDVDGREVDRVLVDDAAGCRIVAEYLAGHGHRRIALLAGHQDTSSGRERTRFFAAALDALGRPLDPALTRWGSHTHATGLAHGLELLDAAEPPTAVLCGSDIVAYGVLEAAHQRGLRVPEDLSVIGFDDIAMSSWSMVGLTTVHQPLEAMGKAAAETLLHRIEHPDSHVPRRQVFDVRLVERATAGPAPRSH